MDEQIKQILDIPFCCGNVVSQMVRGAYCVFSFLNLRLSAEDYLLRLQTTYRLRQRCRYCAQQFVHEVWANKACVVITKDSTHDLL